MNIEIIKKESYSVSEWTGGKTTELCIYPKTSKYSDRNFMWRISAATVDIEESTFTNLPGFSRQLMVTDGETVLEHEGKYKVTLKPFEKDTFMGAWVTKSYGKASDFNLMTSEACSGNIEVLTVKDKVEVEIKGETYEYFYSIGGDIEFTVENEKFDVSEKDLFCVKHELKDDEATIIITNKTGKEVKVIRSLIWVK